MTSLLKRSRRTGIALAIALSLTVLSALGTPLLGDELAQVLPGGVTAVSANDSAGGGG
jgi:hypothetical protein